MPGWACYGCRASRGPRTTGVPAQGLVITNYTKSELRGAPPAAPTRPLQVRRSFCGAAGGDGSRTVDETPRWALGLFLAKIKSGISLEKIREAIIFILVSKNSKYSRCISTFCDPWIAVPEGVCTVRAHIPARRALLGRAGRAGWGGALLQRDARQKGQIALSSSRPEKELFFHGNLSPTETLTVSYAISSPTLGYISPYGTMKMFRQRHSLGQPSQRQAAAMSPHPSFSLHEPTVCGVVPPARVAHTHANATQRTRCVCATTAV
ncbi:hypothetical protein EVAR_4124_1 [Eumeta japonica]|uniref:Uncharacterized protein n=1 Tax=Eumeta variegata TaxID=151549 RepID=A0A4C2A2M7_EUMVA|nr:hypothetical protein EVAR_4124_1 [Eumeta japonica]